MKIYISDTHLDFETPIHMTLEQREQFLDYMHENFPEIGIQEVTELTKQMGHTDHIITKWTADDYLVLLQADSNEEVASKVGKSEMSIVMKRGDFVPNFYSWMNANGYVAPITKKMVEEYLYRGD